MISIEAYRAAIGRHTSTKCPFKKKVNTLCVNELLWILFLCCVLSFVLLPLTIMLTLLSIICITCDLIAIKFCNHMAAFNLTEREFLLYNPRARSCYLMGRSDTSLKFKSRKLIPVLLNCMENLFCGLCNTFIVSCCICIGIDVISRIGNSSVNNDEFNAKVLTSLELYNVAFLKLYQLLVDGDVESNPGPAVNKSGQKGRPRKKKTTFPFKKVDNVILESISHDNPILVECCDPKHVDTSTPIVVICASCSKNITITDPTKRTVTCVHCKAMSKVSKLQAALTPNIVGETNKSMDIDAIETPKLGKSRRNTFNQDLRNTISIVQSERLNDNADTCLNPSENMAISNESSDIDFNITPPIGLKNNGQQVCFFNSIIQILFSLPGYQNYIMQAVVENPVVTNLRNLFNEIHVSDMCVETFKYVKELGIPGYEERTQHDVRECLVHILNESYPSNELKDSSIFKIQCTRTLECECGKKYDRPVMDSIFILDTEDSEMFPSVQGLLDRTLGQYGQQNEHFQCRGDLDDDPNTSDRGCGKRGTCREYTALSVPGDILIIQLQVFRHDENYRPYKYFPKIRIDQELTCYDNFELHGIVWHHGPSINSGHYTSNVKINKWFYTDDRHVTQGLKTYSPTSNNLQNDTTVPYILVYKKIDNIVAPVSLASTPSSCLPELNRNSLIKELSTGIDRIEGIEDDFNSGKRRKLENSTEVAEETIKSDEDVSVSKAAQLKFNFRKRKSKFSDKRETARKRMEKIRATPEGREKSKMINNKSKQKIRATPEGREKSNIIDNKSKQKIRATPEGREKSSIINMESNQKIRATKKRDQEQELENLPFPPVINYDQWKQCLSNFIDATSRTSLQSVECGICGETVRGKEEFKKYNITDIPGRDLISIEQNMDDEGNLDEYVFDDLLLSPGGVEQDQSVVCCKTCLRSLENERLPPLSIANHFQIGKTPPELTDLTLPEKLLISVYRPKMHVVKLRSCSGPQTRQHGLKGNTITFPQDIVKIAASLPANPDILVDHLKVIFLGNIRPTREMLKKVLTVRREKVYNAVNFLIANHPLYVNVTLSNIDLPVDDVPDQIMHTLHAHDDPDDEDANEHSTYTPQTDINDIPSDTVLMDSTGVIDTEGTSVHSTDQLTSAIGSLQGTMYVPHGSIPVNEYNNPNLWLGSYPWLFPYGKGAPEITRKVPVSLKAYIKHLLLLADRKFSLDCSLKFHAFNILQRRDVSLHTSLLVRRSGFHSTAAHIDSLTEESMAELQQCVENKTPITDPNLKTLMKTLTTAGSQIRGSPYQKSCYRREIFGLMIQKGTPVLWITISPAVIHSPIFLQIAGYEVDLSQIPSHIERAKMVANDPVSASIYFNTVIDAFTNYILGYKQPGGGNFGHTSAYYGMTEEQGTGTLHNHMLVWLHGFKSASKLKFDLEDETFRKSLINYLESIIKQGYLGTDSIEEGLDVSEVSCKYPVNPSDEDFEENLAEDVNKLVKVANTHSCRDTCYKYRKKRECRFGFPRDLVPESMIDGNIITLKRTGENINNYNPVIMTCVRSNHDIKFIPSGKDGKNVAFYVTDYATKSQLSTYQMVPLIAASKKQVDASNTYDNMTVRSKALITKCLNRITTETEISGSHVSHFLLGNLDKKTSHCFTRLNLYSALGWLADEMRKYNDLDESITTIDNPVNDDIDDGNDNDDDNEGSTQDDTMYNVSIGNTGFVLVNQMTDYINRGDGLSQMCLYEYCSKVYKTTFTAEEKEKRLKKGYTDTVNKIGRKPQPRHLFSDDHPQSETHRQVVRADGLVPSLSMLPPSIESNKEKYHKCMLLLFKPFRVFTDLFNGISWEDSYETTDFTGYAHYIENIQEMHIGLQEKKDDHDNNENGEDDDDVVHIELPDFDVDPIELNETSIDIQTTEALNIIKTSGWLEESSTNMQNMQQVVDNTGLVSQSTSWEKEIKKQNQDKLDNVESDDHDHEVEERIFITRECTNTEDNCDVVFSVDPCDDIDLDEIATRIIYKYSLNAKQKVAFETAISNVIKRARMEETQQIIGYVGGPGGTGKSQVIKAIVAFHKEIKVKHKLKLCAYTGTAAKNIGGSTTSTLFSFNKANTSKLERRFQNVDTIIIDEVSMIGCRQLAKISNRLTTAKHANPNLPFGGVDIIFFGDFIQFPPVYDNALYCGWDDEIITSSKSNSELQKQIGIHQWKQVNHVILLDEQMRVTDKRYQELLNRLREGKCTDSDIALLNTRVVGHTVDFSSISGNPLITPGNKLVMEVNKLFASHHSQDKQVLLSQAEDSIKKKKVPSNLANLIKNYPSTKTNGLPGELPLFIGMPVFLTANIATELGLTNGTTGVIRSIHLKHGEVINGDTGIRHLDQIPDYIIVELHGISMKPLDGLKPNFVPIFPKTGSFEVTVKGERITINRRHFPLVPQFSCTAHKSQGQTLNKAVVDLLRPKELRGAVEINFAYVPLSRVRTLKDLKILRSFDHSVLKAKVNAGCAAMMEDFKAQDKCRDM